MNGTRSLGTLDVAIDGITHVRVLNNNSYSLVTLTLDKAISLKEGATLYQGNVDASTYITAKVVESTTRRDTVQVRMEQNTLFATGPIYQKLDGNLKSTEANIVSYTIDTFAKGYYSIVDSTATNAPLANRTQNHDAWALATLTVSSGDLLTGSLRVGTNPSANIGEQITITATHRETPTFDRTAAPKARESKLSSVLFQMWFGNVADQRSGELFDALQGYIDVPYKTHIATTFPELDIGGWTGDATVDSVTLLNTLWKLNGDDQDRSAAEAFDADKRTSSRPKRPHRAVWRVHYLFQRVDHDAKQSIDHGSRRIEQKLRRALDPSAVV